MTIDQKARWFDLTGDARLSACATEGCGGQPTKRLEAEGVGSNYCSGCAAKIASLPASDQPFPSHRFDGAREVPSYTSNSSAPASDHAGLVERLESALRDMPSLNHGPIDKAMYRRTMLVLAETVREAATALSAGVRVKGLEEARRRIVAATPETPNSRNAAEAFSWSYSVAKTALSDAPVVTEGKQVQKLTAENERLREALRAADYLIDRLRNAWRGKSVRDMDEAEVAYIAARSALETQEGGE